MTSCMTDQVYLSQHPDGQAKISPCGFSAEPNHNWITHRLSFYSAWVIPHELEWNPGCGVSQTPEGARLQIKGNTSVDNSSWRHPRERIFGEPRRTELQERERSYICQQSHRLFIQPNHRINNVYKVQGETINSGNTATEKTFRQTLFVKHGFLQYMTAPSGKTSQKLSLFCAFYHFDLEITLNRSNCLFNCTQTDSNKLAPFPQWSAHKIRQSELYWSNLHTTKANHAKHNYSVCTAMHHNWVAQNPGGAQNS